LQAPDCRGLADEVDEIRQPPLLGVELGFFQLQRAWEIGAELGDLLFDPLKDIVDLLGV
jgi:hypothetical protein